MKATKEEMLWLLNDTVEYYSKDVNRRCGTNATSCFYSPYSVGKGNISDGCAIGRWMTIEQKEAADDKYENTSVRDLPDELLPNMLKKYSLIFLSGIQSLHDSDKYWGAKGLSTSGISKVDNIKKLIEWGMYD